MLGIHGDEEALTEPAGSVWALPFDQLIYLDGVEASFVGRAAWAIYGDAVPLRPLDSWTNVHHINVLNSDEFGNISPDSDLMIAAPTNAAALTKFYQNVLHRAPEKAGFDFWLDAMTNKGMTLSQVLMSFSDSAENQAQVIGSISDGIEYILYS